MTQNLVVRSSDGVERCRMSYEPGWSVSIEDIEDMSPSPAVPAPVSVPVPEKKVVRRWNRGPRDLDKSRGTPLPDMHHKKMAPGDYVRTPEGKLAKIYQTYPYKNEPYLIGIDPWYEVDDTIKKRTQRQPETLEVLSDAEVAEIRRINSET